MWVVLIASIRRTFKQKIFLSLEQAQCVGETSVYTTDVFPVMENAKWLGLSEQLLKVKLLGEAASSESFSESEAVYQVTDQ